MIAGTEAKTTDAPIEGLVELDGIEYYAIPDIDHLRPFLMSVVSDGDRWMFVSSTGALTAGRVDAAGALFPYDTDDRIHRAAGLTGPVTSIRVVEGSEPVSWTPFRGGTSPEVRRHLYKSVVGESVVFEEVHTQLRLRFRYRWASCDRFGFVRTVSLSNEGDRRVRVDAVDGLVGLLPHGLDTALSQTMSNLTHAYKRSELIGPTGRLAAYSLESGITDTPEPVEVLRASVVWSIGPEDAAVSVSPDTLAEFDTGGSAPTVPLLTGRPGAYLISTSLELDPGMDGTWRIVADVSRDQSEVSDLSHLLEAGQDLTAAVTSATEESRETLVGIMARADALQRTGDPVATAHQFSNVTYNVMRGGIPLSGYSISTSDFGRFLEERNRRVADHHRDWLDSLAPTEDRHDLLVRARATGDPHLVRLALEYLPFSFSRRHGDPSRPWNVFSIRVRDAEGRPLLHYEGNWRDIFQNWEALCMSFPEYLPGVISVFVNASTRDGFNPYRITRHGIDWEAPDPDHPWANIGYWGDHQIVYLLRLLLAADRFLPGTVASMLTERWFTHADVPYRIATYDRLVRDPKETITYAVDEAALADARAAEVGADGKLVWHGDQPMTVTLVEKLLIPALAKLSNFVPGGGIWMNTQRPEWNDANNALVGYGLSMVTLDQLRPYLAHLSDLMRDAAWSSVEITTDVFDWMTAITDALASESPAAGRADDRNRRRLLDRLGTAFSTYRDRVFSTGSTATTTVSPGDVLALCDAALAHLDDTIRANRRPDGLYHSYNLIHFGEDTAAVGHLYEMLEGQVAVLESGVLDPAERADVLDALFASAMFRADQGSFMLYPPRTLPSFLDKNVIASDLVAGNPLLSALVGSGDRSVVVVDPDGRHRFAPDLASEHDVRMALGALTVDPRWEPLVSEHGDAVVGLYEHVFGHRAYTGRSASMYGYEGIGSIYWHMVAKLLVAAQEAVLDAAGSTTGPDLERLTAAYRRIRSGLGFNKTAREFGAIPIDPYSHSPAHSGAQQPGMTGLVKEEILTRPLELGVRVSEGSIVFDPVLLERDELLAAPTTWTLHGLDLDVEHIELTAGSLGLTVCQVPVVVQETAGDPGIEVSMRDGSSVHVPGLRLDVDTSARIFARTGDVVRLHAHVPASEGDAR